MSDKILSPRDQEIIETARKISDSKKAKLYKANIIDKKTRKKSADKAIKQLQDELSTPMRIASQVLHSKPIEAASDLLSKTIARPNALLAGSVASFVLTLGVYIISKVIGYELSGFETIAAFIFGWAIGILYDYFMLLITGK
jgi:uncharacterized membrane protein